MTTPATMTCVNGSGGENSAPTTNPTRTSWNRRIPNRVREAVQREAVHQELTDAPLGSFASRRRGLNNTPNTVDVGDVETVVGGDLFGGFSSVKHPLCDAVDANTPPFDSWRTAQRFVRRNDFSR